MWCSADLILFLLLHRTFLYTWQLVTTTQYQGAKKMKSTEVLILVTDMAMVVKVKIAGVSEAAFISLTA